MEHIRADAPMSRASLCGNLEGILRSVRLVQEIVFRRQPPAFSILSTLLEATDHLMSIPLLRDLSSRHAEELCAAVASGEILGRDDQLRLYRRVLYEARRSDLQIDGSESTLLGVLRRELGIAHVEHFLIEYHPDLQEFWRHPDSFNHELHGLVSVGLLFVTDEGGVAMGADVAPLVGQALGIDMSVDAARRLISALSSSDLAEALGRIAARTSGTKEERIERLLSNRVQPRAILRWLSLQALRELARDSGAAAYGSKEELSDRIIAQYAAGSDQVAPPPPEPEPTPEDRTLDERRFGLLFGSLKGAELAQILEALPELRQSGTKEVRSATLWAAQKSETTLLSELKNRDLEEILIRQGLRIGGSKLDRIERLVAYFAGLDPDHVPPTLADAGEASTSQKGAGQPSQGDSGQSDSKQENSA